MKTKWQEYMEVARSHGYWSPVQIRYILTFKYNFAWYFSDEMFNYLLLTQPLH